MKPRILAALLLMAAPAAAQTQAPAQAQAPATDFPQHPITFIMTFPAGSGVDVVARTIQEPLGKVLGQPIVIDYKVGAAGNVASEHADAVLLGPPGFEPGRDGL